MNTAPVVGCRCFLPLFCHFFPTERSGPSAASDEGDDDDYVDGQNGYVGGHGDSVGCHDDSVGGYDDVNVVWKKVPLPSLQALGSFSPRPAEGKTKKNKKAGP